MTELMSLDEVAIELRQDIRWIKRVLIKGRAIEFIKLGHGKYFVTPRALKDYLQRRTTHTHVREWSAQPLPRAKKGK